MYLKHEVSSMLLSASASGGDVIAIVQFADGAYGLTRNGQPITGFYWRDLDRNLDDCVEALMRVAGVDCPTGKVSDTDLSRVAAPV